MTNTLFCLPPQVRDSSKLSDIFEWMEIELNKLIANAQPNAQVAQIYTAHLSKNFPCQR
jgi:hypothetical protein